MNAKANVQHIGFDKNEPASIEDAQRERMRIVEEIQRLQAWIAGVHTDGSGIRVSSQDYHRQRADVIHKLTQRQFRAGFLRKWIHAQTVACPELVGTVHPNKQLLAKCYAALLRYGDEHDQLIQAIEAALPMPLLEAAVQNA